MSRTEHTDHRNLAARMGRWSAAHWKTATFGWLAFVAAAFTLGGMVGTTTIDTDAPGPGESGRMNEILDAGFRLPAGESVLERVALQGRSLREHTARGTIVNAVFLAGLKKRVQGGEAFTALARAHSDSETRARRRCIQPVAAPVITTAIRATRVMVMTKPMSTVPSLRPPSMICCTATGTITRPAVATTATSANAALIA